MKSNRHRLLSCVVVVSYAVIAVALFGRSHLSDIVKDAHLLLLIVGYFIVVLMHIWCPAQFGGWLVVIPFPQSKVKDSTLRRVGWYMLLAPMFLMLILGAYMRVAG